MLKNIYDQINKINIRLSKLENSNNDKIDVESLIITNKILINSDINTIRNRIISIEEKLEEINSKIEIKKY